MGTTVFISYSHKDMSPIHWLERLQMYLAPFRREGAVQTWADTDIPTGSDWRAEIQKAIEGAVVAVLLVGPGFLASGFIATEELPSILNQMQARENLRIFPLIIGYSSYVQSSLGKFQSFNDPSAPLEALPTPDQNKILNALSIRVAESLREGPVIKTSEVRVSKEELAQGMSAIQQHLRSTRTAFIAQCNRRDDLVERMRKRLKIKTNMEYEKFFFKYFSQMDEDEQFEFAQIRAITEGSLYRGNSAVLEILNRYPNLFQQAPQLANLQQHLVFWLNKYEKLFTKTPEMAVLYTGVEDGVPFPSGIDAVVGAWLRKNV